MENNVVTIELQAEKGNQSFARAVCGAYFALMDPTAAELLELKTAVSEAVSNAIIHGYKSLGKGIIKISLATLSKSRIKVVIEDFGKGIQDIERAMEPLYSTMSDYEMSGMGFTVMESFTDKMSVESEPGKGTKVTLIKSTEGIE